jgi:hypothetical protein
MNDIKSKHVDINNIEFSAPSPYSKGNGHAINFKYNNKILNMQTPKLLCLYDLNMYKNDKDVITSINMTLQFNSASDKTNRVDNFLKKITKIDNLVMTNAFNNYKTWLKSHRSIPVSQLKALYKKSLYYKLNPESGEIDHSVPPTFKIKIPYRNNKFDSNFIVLDEDNKPVDFDLEYLQAKIVAKCYIKCIFNPSIYVIDKNFGITYKALAIQIIENHNKQDFIPKKNSKNKDNPNKIENYFGKKDESDDDNDDDDDDILDL